MFENCLNPKIALSETCKRESQKYLDIDNEYINLKE